MDGRMDGWSWDWRGLGRKGQVGGNGMGLMGKGQWSEKGGVERGDGRGKGIKVDVVPPRCGLEEGVML